MFNIKKVDGRLLHAKELGSKKTNEASYMETHTIQHTE